MYVIHIDYNLSIITTATGHSLLETGSVRISETGHSIVSYELRSADADPGLARVPYAKYLRRPDCFFPAEWVFTFTNP